MLIILTALLTRGEKGHKPKYDSRKNLFMQEGRN
jgi:hypothetical protein